MKALGLHDARYETSDPQSIRRLQLAKLKRLLRETWRRNPFYRDLWERAGADPERVDSLAAFAAEIPPVRKQDFVADQDQAPPFGRRAAAVLQSHSPLIVYHTNGTSGQGVEVHVQTHAEAAAVNEGYRSLYRWTGLKSGDHVFVCYPVSLHAGGQMDVSTLHAYGCTVYPVGNYDARQKLALLERFGPRVIVGTPSYLLHLAAVSGARPPGPRTELLLCSGETGGLALFRRLEELWGARAVSIYGASQIRADPMATCEQPIVTSRRPAMLHNLDPFYLLEVVDPATGAPVRDGERGEIVFTSLIHRAVPLIRCATGDHAVFRAAGSCNCGRPFSGVEVGSIGRLDEMKKIKGVSVWPQAVEELLFGIAEVDEYQILLRRDAYEADTVTARLFLNRPPDFEVAGELRRRVAMLLRERTGLRFEIELAQRQPDVGVDSKARRWIDERAPA
jgi:phenylacetate-CoA ligase